VNITNNLCANPSACTTVSGLRVSGLSGTGGPQVDITNPIANPSLGTITLSPNAAHLSVSGPNTRLTIGR